MLWPAAELEHDGCGRAIRDVRVDASGLSESDAVVVSSLNSRLQPVKLSHVRLMVGTLLSELDQLPPPSVVDALLKGLATRSRARTLTEFSFGVSGGPSALIELAKSGASITPLRFGLGCDLPCPTISQLRQALPYTADTSSHSVTSHSIARMRTHGLQDLTCRWHRRRFGISGSRSTKVHSLFSRMPHSSASSPKRSVLFSSKESAARSATQRTTFLMP